MAVFRAVLALFCVLPFAASLTLLVPAYFDPPSADWNKLIAAASKVVLTVIANPEDGPGSAFDAAYNNSINKVRSAGGKVVGYVATGYGKRAVDAVLADVRKWKGFYKLDGIFLDEFPDTTNYIPNYAKIYQGIKSLASNYLIIGNPGTSVPQTYLSTPIADQLVVFESNIADYNSYKATTWQSNYPKSLFHHIVYNVPAGNLNSVITKAKQSAGGVYVTSLTLPNPYEKLPTYWDAVVNAA